MKTKKERKMECEILLGILDLHDVCIDAELPYDTESVKLLIDSYRLFVQEILEEVKADLGSQ